MRTLPTSRNGSVWALLVACCIMFALTGATCPPGQQQNQAPEAQAGNNQTVAQGAAVTLDGSDSDDPDGDDLEFEWEQTAGTAVTLSGANTDTATFTAPNANDVLTFQLTVDDGNGGTDTDTVVVTVGTGNNVTPQLFIANLGGDRVTSYENPDTVNGNIVPDTNLAGAQTQLDGPSDIVVNAAGQLLVSNIDGESITTYDDAANSNGNLAPDGNVQGAATQLVDPVTLAINTGQDLLFVADLNTDDILVYENTTSAAFNGNLAPVRTIQSPDVINPLGINFGDDDDLYVADSGGGGRVLVFANASTLNGNVNATRILTNASFPSIFDVFIDGNDTLFVVLIPGEILIFNNASTLNGAVAPDFTLDVPPALFLSAIAVDSNDTGYIVDTAANAIYSYDNISTLNGSINPDRTIQGANTQLSGPIRVFLVE